MRGWLAIPKCLICFHRTHQANIGLSHYLKKCKQNIG